MDNGKYVNHHNICKLGSMLTTKSTVMMSVSMVNHGHFRTQKYVIINVGTSSCKASVISITF